MEDLNLTIVVCCNKKDFFFAKICIASIRYYYPTIPIELVKDNGNGGFNTGELQKYFDVNIVDFGIPRLGWSGAKFHYLYKMPAGKKVLIIDADIVFVGPFLERLQPYYLHNDYVVSPEFESNPYAKWVDDIYFKTSQIEATYPEYKYPGYFFNAGQIFLTGGAIPEAVLNQFFDKEQFPFWKHKHLFPAVDQSVYNYILPTLASKASIQLGLCTFMLWSKSQQTKDLCISKVINKTYTEGLIHWAGDIRRADLRGMSRKDILFFFENFYYIKIPFGNLKLFYLKWLTKMRYLSLQLIYIAKKLK